MCVKPTTIYLAKGPKMEPMKVPCKYCWACLQNQQDDVIGRCLLEAEVSDWTLALTLTYDDKKLRDPTQATSIHKLDLQQFLYRMRATKKRGGKNIRYNIRYLAAGEYGKKKRRSHFHIILFGKGPMPEIALNTKKQYLDEWPWGYTYADDQVDYRAMRYVAKYMIKAKREKRYKNPNPSEIEWVTYSKVPLLGAGGIALRAMEQASARTMPHVLRYTPKGAREKSQYSMYGKAIDIYFDTLIAEWPGALTAPANEWITNARNGYIKRKQKAHWAFLQKNNALHVTDWHIYNTSPTLPYREPLTEERKESDKLWEQYKHDVLLVEAREWQDAQIVAQEVIAEHLWHKHHDKLHDQATRD